MYGVTPAWAFYAAFDVLDWDKDVVTVSVYHQGSVKRSAWRIRITNAAQTLTRLSPALVGRVSCPVRDAAWLPGTPLPAPEAVSLGEGNGQVRLHLILVAAPAAAAPLRCLTATWNVGNAAPPASLADWLRNDGDAAELIAVGTQECAYPPRAPHATCDADWLACVGAAVGPAYRVVRHDTLGQMRLTVFARWDAMAGIGSHQATHEATGLGHMHSNKGGVVSVVTLWDTSVCFVSAHLAAHQGHVKRRNSDYCEIVNNCVIGERGINLMSQFTHVLWMGDLNYRLETAIPIPYLL